MPCPGACTAPFIYRFPLAAPVAPQRVPGAAMAWTMAIGAHVAWGYLAPGGKILLEWWPEWSLNAVRLIAATLVLMLIYGRSETRYALKALLVDKNLLILGVVGIGFTFGLYIASLRYIEATAAAVLIFLAPFLTAAIARIAIKEPIGWHLPVAASIVLVGAYFTLFGVESLITALLVAGVGFGIAINLGSVLLWAVYTVHLRVVAPRYPLSRLMIATFTAASGFYLIMALLADRDRMDWSAALSPVPLIHLSIYIAFPSIIAYLLYSAAIGRVGAGPITILLGVELIVTSIAAHLLLNELFPPIRIIGLALAGIAVAWFVWMQNRFERLGAAAAPA
jgi:drug/metabolite transporter (DMT)-like permease